MTFTFYSLPNDNILAWSKLEAFAHDKIGVLRMVISLFDRVENNVEKGENEDYQHCFPKPFSLGSLKVRIVW